MTSLQEYGMNFVIAGELTTDSALKAMDDIIVAAARAQQIPGFLEFFKLSM